MNQNAIMDYNFIYLLNIIHSGTSKNNNNQAYIVNNSEHIQEYY